MKVKLTKTEKGPHYLRAVRAHRRLVAQQKQAGEMWDRFVLFIVKRRMQRMMQNNWRAQLKPAGDDTGINVEDVKPAVLSF